MNQIIFLNNRLTFSSEDKLFDVEYQVDNDDMSTQSAYDYDTDSSMEICLSINLSKYNFAAIVLNRQLTPDEKCGRIVSETEVTFEQCCATVNLLD